jgi:ABC-type multidrug transport system ATPase subunit
MRVAERIHALNEGRTLATGPPEEIRHDHAVIEAYLGAEHVHEALEASESITGREQQAASSGDA